MKTLTVSGRSTDKSLSESREFGVTHTTAISSSREGVPTEAAWAAGQAASKERCLLPLGRRASTERARPGLHTPALPNADHSATPTRGRARLLSSGVPDLADTPGTSLFVDSLECPCRRDLV